MFFQGIKKARTALKKGLFLQCDRLYPIKQNKKRIRWRIHIILKLCNNYARQHMMIKRKKPSLRAFFTEYYRKQEVAVFHEAFVVFSFVIYCVNLYCFSAKRYDNNLLSCELQLEVISGLIKTGPPL